MTGGISRCRRFGKLNKDSMKKKLKVQVNPVSVHSGKKQLLAKGWLLTVTLCIYQMLWSVTAYCQDGAAGINEATNKVKGYFDSGCNLMYAIGAVVGLIGAVKVFNKWNAGEPDTNKVAAAWFGSCIFLVVVATVLKSFFGI
jgi:hypothetical protein